MEIFTAALVVRGLEIYKHSVTQYKYFFLKYTASVIIQVLTYLLTYLLTYSLHVAESFLRS